MNKDLENNIEDTIVALTTPFGESSTAIIRVSGNEVKNIIKTVSLNHSKILKNKRTLIKTKIVDKNKNTIDYALVSFFSSPKSFTGEDTLELNIHGSPYIIEELLDLLTSFKGTRLAEPGEFSKRAFLNGKLDLTQAEAIADLISAKTKIQVEASKKQLEGKLKDSITLLGEPLKNLLAEIEAYLDFPEEDISPMGANKWIPLIKESKKVIKSYIDSYKTGKIIREGCKIVLAGHPNAGKSSLLNTLLKEKRAIVTSTPGTTRDTIEESININGMLAKIIDTAGLKTKTHKPSSIEEIGINYSWKKIKEADLVLYIIDSLNSNIKEEIKTIKKIKTYSRNIIVVFNKVDLIKEKVSNFDFPFIYISALKEEGIIELKNLIYSSFIKMKITNNPSFIITTKRHLDALKKADTSLTEAINSVNNSLPPELTSINIRHALFSLEEIIGVTQTEEILGKVFSKFCIGK